MTINPQDLHAYVALLRQLIPANAWDQCIHWLGYAALALKVVPWITNILAPASVRLADRLVALAMASPFRPLILWKAADIASFLKSLQAALNGLTDTFLGQIEADLKKASDDANQKTPA